MFLLSTTQTFFWVNNCISIDLHFPFSRLSSIFLRAHPSAVFYTQGDGRSSCLHASSRVARSPCSTQQCRCSSPSLLGCTQFPYYFFPTMSIALNQRQVPWREMLMHLLSPATQVKCIQWNTTGSESITLERQRKKSCVLVTQEHGPGNRAGDQQLWNVVAGLLILSPMWNYLGSELCHHSSLSPYRNEVANTMLSHLLGREGGQIL